MPKPRLPVCVPPRVFQTYFQSSRPSRASIAQALSGLVAYNTPPTASTLPTIRAERPPLSFSSPVPSPPTIVGTAGPPPPKPPRPPAAAGIPGWIRVLHARVRFLTLARLICVSALYRRPE